MADDKANALRLLSALSSDPRLKKWQVLTIKDLPVTPDGRGLRPVREDDVVLPNAEFGRNQLMRVTVGRVDLDAVTVKRMEEDMEAQRKYAMEAAIVRVMKTRKRLTHNDLVAEVIAQLKTFRGDPKHMKRVIEDLIGRDYLERDDEDPSIYNYLA